MRKRYDPAQVRQFYIRVCKDSNFEMAWDRAAAFTGDAFKLHPLEVADCFPYIKDMQELADGTHRIYNV